MVKMKEAKKQAELNERAQIHAMEENNNLDINKDGEEMETPFLNLEGEGRMGQSLDMSGSVKKKKEMMPTSTFALADKMAEDIREKEI